MNKDKRKLMEDASEAWVMENPQNRTIFCVIGDKETNTTSCGVHGREDLICEALANECLADDTIFALLCTAIEVVKRVKKEDSNTKNKTPIAWS
jgi:hypothetical protein